MKPLIDNQYELDKERNLIVSIYKTQSSYKAYAEELPALYGESDSEVKAVAICLRKIAERLEEVGHFVTGTAR